MFRVITMKDSTASENVRYGSARYGTARYQASRIGKLIGGIIAAILVITVIFGAVYAFVQFVGRYIELFPPSINKETVQSLLSGIIQVDGILLGFFGLIFASILGGLQSQSVTVTGELLKSLHMVGLVGTEQMRKRLKVSGTAEYEYQRMLSQLEPMRKSALQWLGITSLLLITSILWSFSRMTITENTLPRGELFWSIAPLFVAIVTFLWGISRVKSVTFE